MFLSKILMKSMQVDQNSLLTILIGNPPRALAMLRNSIGSVLCKACRKLENCSAALKLESYFLGSSSQAALAQNEWLASLLHYVWVSDQSFLILGNWYHIKVNLFSNHFMTMENSETTIVSESEPKMLHLHPYTNSCWYYVFLKWGIINWIRILFLLIFSQREKK